MIVLLYIFICFEENNDKHIVPMNVNQWQIEGWAQGGPGPPVLSGNYFFCKYLDYSFKKQLQWSGMVLKLLVQLLIIIHNNNNNNNSA